MSRNQVITRALGLLPMLLVAAAMAITAMMPDVHQPIEPTHRDISITARQYGYRPSRIAVNPGDTVTLRLGSQDVVHGFYLEGHDLEAVVRPGRLKFKVRHPSLDEAFQEVDSVTFTVGRPGKYRYRCSVTCGTLHPFMQGEMIVRPNIPYRVGVVGTVGVLLVMLVGTQPHSRSQYPGVGSTTTLSRRTDLLATFPRLAWLVSKRWFQFAAVAPMVVVLFFFIAAGLFGSPIGSRNIVVTIVWIFWWFLLISLLVPLGGRVWCTACPIPFLGEWLARRRLVDVRTTAEQSRSLRTGSMNRGWPARFRGLWLQSAFFLTMCTVSTILVTRPALTAYVLAGMVGAAVLAHAVFRRRSFCRHLCPLNSWLSIYSMASMVEVRVRDPRICTGCGEKSCAAGSDRGWGCPWLVNPSKLQRNNYCGLCMECIKSCANKNLTLKARPFCADVEITRLDEAWMALMMVALVIAYTVTLLGPWATPKAWANVTESGNVAGFALHTAAVWFLAVVALPTLWYAGAWLARRLAGATDIPLRLVFARFSFLLVPFGLLAWAAFSVPLIMVNFTHITGSLSDPFGWGWNLFGAANSHWEPLMPEAIPYLQVPMLVGGLAIALSRGKIIASTLFSNPASASRGLIPHGVLSTVIALALLRLFVG